jgi:hypothetical protein
LLKHALFANHTDVYRFEQLPGYFRSLKELIIHIPEYLVRYFVDDLTRHDSAWLKGISHLHLNILNQNVRFMPDASIIARARKLAHEVTVTTAHQKYCTLSYRNQYGVPLHKLSVWISPEQYKFKTWREKENLLVVSPDLHPLKEQASGNT